MNSHFSNSSMLETQYYKIEPSLELYKWVMYSIMGQVKFVEDSI